MVYVPNFMPRMKADRLYWFHMQGSICGIWYASILGKCVGHSISHEIKWGNIDVGDGCWRHLVLMTSGVDASEMLVWWPIWNVGDWSHKIMQFEQCLKHLFLNGRRHNVRSDVRILNSDITESRLILNIPSRSPNGKKWIVIRIYFGLEYWLIQKPERLSTSETRSFSIYNYVFTQNLFHS